MPHQQADPWEQLQRAADAAVLRGGVLFRLDLATELARAALERGGIAFDTLVTDIDGRGHVVAALAWGVEPRVTAEILFADDGRPTIATLARPASARELALARCRQAVERAAAFTANVDHAILPVPAGTLTEAYAIRLGRNEDEIILGVHWRLTLDNGEVAACEPLSKSALTIERAAPGRVITVTHFGAVPDEIHSYLALKHGVPLDVVALESDVRWIVDGDGARMQGVVPTAAH